MLLPPDHAIMQCRHVGKIYPTGDLDLTVLSDLELEVRPREFIAITGESGCGKSTLLHLLGCLDDPTTGEIYFQNRVYSSLPASQKNRMRNLDFGFVFQFHHLLPEFNALENVILPGMIAGRPEKELIEAGTELLSDLRLLERKNHKPAQLSGGEQQRVAVARAMINQPAMLFMDEPTGNLDPEHSHELIELIRQQQRKRQLTIILVTHNREIASLADRPFLLVDGKLADISLSHESSG